MNNRQSLMKPLLVLACMVFVSLPIAPVMGAGAGAGDIHGLSPVTDPAWCWLVPFYCHPTWPPVDPIEIPIIPGACITDLHGIRHCPYPPFTITDTP